MELEGPVVPKRIIESFERLRYRMPDWTRDGLPTSSSSEIFSNFKLHPSYVLPSNQQGTSTAGMVTKANDFNTLVPSSETNAKAQQELSFMKGTELTSYTKKAEDQEKRKDRARVSSCNNRKKLKAPVPSTPPVTSGHDDEGNPLTARPRRRAPFSAKGEKVAKRQNLQGRKRQDESRSSIQHGQCSLLERPLKDSSLQRNTNMGNTGVLDVYGLKALPVDISKRIAAVSIEDLLSKQTDPPQTDLTTVASRHNEVENAIIKEVFNVLKIIPKTNNTKESSEVLASGSNPQDKEVRCYPQYHGNHEDASCMLDSKRAQALKGTADTGSSIQITEHTLQEMHKLVNMLGLCAGEPLEGLLEPGKERCIEENELLKTDKYLKIPLLPAINMQNGTCRPAQRNDRELKHPSRWFKCSAQKIGNKSSELYLMPITEKNPVSVTSEEQTDGNTCNAVLERVGMIDLNVMSTEHLLDSSMDLPEDMPFVSGSLFGIPCSLMNKPFSEAKNREEIIIVSNTNRCIAAGENTAPLVNTNASFDDNDGLETSKPSSADRLNVLQNKAESVKCNCMKAINLKLQPNSKNMQTTSTEDKPEFHSLQSNCKKAILISSKSVKNVSREDIRCDSSLEINASKDNIQKSELDIEISEVPDSPRVKKAARILCHMSNSHNNHHDQFSSKQEGSVFPGQGSRKRVLVQKTSSRKTVFVQRRMDVQSGINGNLNEIVNSKEAKIKISTIERPASNTLLTPKRKLARNMKVEVSKRNKNTSRKCNFAFVNKQYQGSTELLQDCREVDKSPSDYRIQSCASSSAKQITDDSHFKSKRNSLGRSKHDLEDLQLKSNCTNGVLLSSKFEDLTKEDVLHLDLGKQQKRANIAHLQTSRHVASSSGRRRRS